MVLISVESRTGYSGICLYMRCLCHLQLDFNIRDSTFLRNWHHLHHFMSSLCCYSAHSPCFLPIKSLTPVLKDSKTSGHIPPKCSHDPLVSNCHPKLQAGTLQVEKTVNKTQQEIKLQLMSSYHGNHGVGYRNIPKVLEEKSTKCYREFKEIDETYNISKAVQLPRQWKRWLSYSQRDSLGSLHQSTLSRFDTFNIFKSFAFDS